MNLITYHSEEGTTQYVFIDKNEIVVEHPTFFIRSKLKSSLYSIKSVHHYAKVLKYFCSYLELTFPNLSCDEIICSIDGMFISEYFKYLSDCNLSAATIRNRDAIIKEFMEWLTTIEGGKVKDNTGYIKNKYKTPKPNRKIPKILMLDEIIQLINSLHEESQRCIIHFLYDTGIRVSELPRVKIKDIPNLSEYSSEINYFKLRVDGSKGRGGKTKERLTYISRAMIQRVNRLHTQNKKYRKASLIFKENMPCFLNTHGGEITENAIRALLRQAALRSKLDPKKYSAHKYRHSFAVSILSSEYDKEFTNKLVMTKEALGHNQIKSTEIYTSIAPIAIENLQMKNKSHDINFRYEASQRIYEETFKPQKNHIEKRGRNNGRK
ncbi:tyrosine-type recombinase/integrase [Bacillus haimaensis]|uniref:tyrosine-type recombinase/integrase n=1 Tax=Bacillus haimaensis TaxID=3160967 RepID=UPI003AA9ABEC